MRVRVSQNLILRASARKISPGGGGGHLHDNEGRPRAAARGASLMWKGAGPPSTSQLGAAPSYEMQRISHDLRCAQLKYAIFQMTSSSSSTKIIIKARFSSSHFKKSSHHRCCVYFIIALSCSLFVCGYLSIDLSPHQHHIFIFR